MKTKNTNIAKRLSVWTGIVGVILSIPLVARWPWTSFDFTFAAIVLFGSATVYELATKNINNKMHRITVGFVVLVFLVLVQAWAAAGPD